MPVEWIWCNEEKANHFRSDGRPVGPAICGLHVRDDARPAAYEVLRLHALRSIQSKSRLLQGDGFGAVTECPTCFARNSPCPRHGRRGRSRVAASSAVSRSFSFGVRWAAAFASQVVHASRFPLDLIRF
jgi:hypothetical protein